MPESPCWIILAYENIAWEDTPWTRAAEWGTCPPDLFADHVARAAELGELVSVPEGMRRILGGKAERPLFSLWFDFGLSGVARHAAPLLERYKVTGAVSVNSRFLQRREMFWRYQLSFLRHVDGFEALRARLERFGYRGGSVAGFILDHFEPDLLREIHTLYMRFTADAPRRDAFRLFAAPDMLRGLQARGWTMANGTAAGYPVGSPNGVQYLAAQFEECEQVFQETFGQPSRYWVVPFDEPEARAANLAETYQAHGGDRVLVLDGGCANTAKNGAAGVLARVRAPLVRGKAFVRRMQQVLKASRQQA